MRNTVVIGNPIRLLGVLLIVAAMLSSCGSKDNANSSGGSRSIVTSGGQSGGDGTRGGGDSCQMDFKHHLNVALDWLRTRKETMSKTEWEKVRALLYKDDTETGDYEFVRSGQFSHECSNQRLFIGTEEKTAITTSYIDPNNNGFQHARFKTEVNIGRWFAPSDDFIRTALACHEAMVIAGVEKTNDEHVCIQYIREHEISAPIKSVECIQNVQLQDLLSVRIERDPNQENQMLAYRGFQLVLELRRASSLKQSAEELLNEPPAERLIQPIDAACFYGHKDPNIFQCRVWPYQGATILSNNRQSDYGEDVYAWEFNFKELPRVKEWFVKNISSNNIGYRIGVPVDYSTSEKVKLAFLMNNSSRFLREIPEQLKHSGCTMKVMTSDETRR